MARWRKLLATVVADRRPVSYTYDELASLLEHLGFTLATPIDGSHRRFRLVLDADNPNKKRTVTIGLLDKGRGTVAPEYVKAMIKVLAENNLLPDGV